MSGTNFESAEPSDSIADQANAATLRAASLAMWTSVARSWGERADFIDARSADVTHAMLDAADLRPGEDILEVACGPGGVGMAAAEIVGPTGSVVLSDFAAEMTAIAAERVKGRRLPNVTTRELDLERIDYAQGLFDAVLCRDGLMFALDLPAATREVRRILRPAGRAVFAVWGPRERNPWLGILFDAVSGHLGMTIPPPGMPGPFSLGTPGVIESLLVEAGFTDVAAYEVSAPMQTPSPDEWWSVIPSLAGPLAQLLAALPAEATAAIRSDAEAALARFATPHGYDLPGVSIIGVGHRGA